MKLRVIPKILFSSHRMECGKRFPVELNEGLNGFERKKIPQEVSHFSLAPKIVDGNLFEFHAGLNPPSCVLVVQIIRSKLGTLRSKEIAAVRV